MNTLALGNWNWRSRAEQKRNSSWCNCGPTSNGNRARVADDIRPLKEPSTIGRAIGGPGRDRTDDLFHAISHLGLERNDTVESRVILRGSVHTGPTPIPFPHGYPSD